MDNNEIKEIIDDVIKAADLLADREVTLRIKMYSKYNILISEHDLEMNKIFNRINSYNEPYLKKSSTYSHDFETRLT